MRGDKYTKNSQLILKLLIFSFFISFIHPQFIIARESEAGQLKENFYVFIKRNLKRDLIFKLYNKLPPRVLSEHLKIYRNFSPGTIENSSNNFQGQTEAGLPGVRDQVLQEVRQGSGLFNEIYEPNPYPLLFKGANLLSFGLNFTGPLRFGSKTLKFSAMRLGINANLGQLLNFSKDGIWNNPLHRRMQATAFIIDLMEQLDARKTFLKQFPSALKSGDRDVGFPISSGWEVDGNLIRFQDQEGKDRVFDSELLNRIEKSTEGERIIEYMNELDSKSFDELFHYFPEEFAVYNQLYDNKLMEDFIDIFLAHREESAQNQEKIKDSLIHFMEEVSKVSVEMNRNGDFFLRLGDRSFVPQSLEEINGAIGNQMEHLEAVESELMNFDLSKKERERLESEKSFYQKKIKNLEHQRIERVGRIFQNAISAGREATYFFARIFNANPKIMRAIDKRQRELEGFILVGTSIARLHAGDPFALASLFQGLNMSLSALEGGQRSIEKSMEAMFQRQTDLILASIREGVHLGIQNQMDIHKDLTRQLIDSEARLTVEIQIAGDKVDHVQRYLYTLGDLLIQGIEQIREDISQVNSLYLSGQKNLMETQGEILSRIHSLGEQVSWEIQRTTIQNILNRASGFRELFYDDTSTNIISCRDDVNQCTESEKSQMLEIKKLMGELVSHIQTTLRSGESSSPFRNLRKEELISYLSEKRRGRVEDRLHLFSLIAEWLNEHIELSQVREEAVLATDGDSVSENKAFVLEELLELFTYLSHPDLLYLILDQYVELGNYLPQNEIKIPQGFDGRTYVNRGMDAICRESLKHRKATQKMRELVPFAWRVYKGYLNQIHEVYSQLKVGYKKLFYETIVGFNVGFDPIVKSPLFVEDFSTQVEVIPDESVSHSEGEKTIPKDIEVSLRDLLFLPESKIEIFVDKLTGEEREELSKKMGAYTYKEASPQKEDQCRIEEGCSETSTCEVREWEEVNNPEPLFPDGKGLTVNFWGPESFEIVKSFDPYLDYSYEKSFKKLGFNCESKGEGHHVVEIYSQPWLDKADLLFGIKLGRDRQRIGGTWVHYVCKEVEESFYDEKGNRYSGKTWKVEVYKRTDTSSEEGFLSSEGWGLNVCSTCAAENGKRCATVDVIQDEFDIKMGYVLDQKDWPPGFYFPDIAGKMGIKMDYSIATERVRNTNRMKNFPATLRYHCDWQKPKKKETCKRFKRRQIVVRKREISRIELIEKLKDLRWHVLGQFKKHAYSIFSGESVDPSIVEVQEFHRALLKNLSLSKLALVSLIYGGYGRVFVESPMGFSLYSLIQQMPSGYGAEGMTLLTRYPGDQSFSIISKTPNTHYAFRGWMFRMDQGFLLPEEIDLKEIDKIFQISNEGEEIDSTFVLGFGRPAYVHNLLTLASTNRNLMMSEECLREHDLSYNPFVLQTQFSALGSDSVEEKVNLAQFVGDELSTESGGKKGQSILLIQAQDSDSSVRREVIFSALKLDNEEGLEVLELLAFDPDRETQALVAQTIVDFPVVVNKKRKSEVLKTLLGNPEITQETFSLIERRALKIMGLEGTDEGALSSYSLIFNLSQLSASENEYASEAIVFLNALFNSVDFKQIEDRLIHLGLLQMETKREENDFYRFFQRLLELGVSGNKEAILLFDLLIQYIEKSEEKRKRMVDLVPSFSRELEQEERFLILSQFVGDEKEDVKIALAQAVGEIGGSLGIQILEKLSVDQSWRVREVVAQVVGRIGGSAGIQILQELVGDQNSDVREAVHQAKFTIVKKAGEIGANKGFQVLKEFSGDQNLDIRVAVVQAAGEMGGIAGVQILEELFSDQNSDVREALHQAKFTIIKKAGEMGGSEGFQVLEKLIGDQNLDVRMGVVQSAEKMGSILGAQILEKLIGDENSEVREAVHQAKFTVIKKVGEGGDSEGFQVLEKLRHDQHSDIRVAVAQAAGEMGGITGVRILDRLIGDENWYVKVAVIQAAREMIDIENWILEKLSSDKSWYVKKAVAYAAGRMGGAAGIRILEKLSDDQNERVRAATAQATGDIGGSEGIRILEKLSDDQGFYYVEGEGGFPSEEERTVKGAVAQAVGKIRGGEGVFIFRRLIDDQNWKVRRSLAWAAGEVGGSAGIQILKILIYDREFFVRLGVVQAAGRIGGSTGIQFLEKLRRDQHPGIRKEVAYALGRMGSVEGIQILEKLSGDGNLEVRVAVARAVGRIGSSAGIQILEKLSGYENVELRKAVAEAVGRIGSSAGIQILEKLLIGDQDRSVKHAVVWAIGRIGSSTGVQLLERIGLEKFKGKEFYFYLELKDAVVQAARKIEGSAGIQVLEKLVRASTKAENDPSFYDIRMALVWIAEKKGGTTGLQILKELSGHQSLIVRAEVAYALGRIGSVAGIQILEKLSGDQSEKVRAAAAWAAGDIGGGAGIQILEKLSSDQNWDVKNAVVSAIGRMGGSAGIQILEKLSSEKSLARELIVVCSAMGGSEGIQILERLISSGDQYLDVWGVREALAEFAGKIGGITGIQILEKLSSDLSKLKGFEASNVRTAVIQAAGRMGGSAGVQILQEFSGDQDLDSSVIAKVDQALVKVLRLQLGLSEGAMP